MFKPSYIVDLYAFEHGQYGVGIYRSKFTAPFSRELYVFFPRSVDPVDYANNLNLALICISKLYLSGHKIRFSYVF